MDFNKDIDELHAGADHNEEDDMSDEADISDSCAADAVSRGFVSVVKNDRHSPGSPKCDEDIDDEDDISTVKKGARDSGLG